METAFDILNRVASAGRLRMSRPIGRPMSPVSPEIEAMSAEQTAKLSHHVAPGMPFDDWLRMNDKNPAFARQVLRALGNPIPEFPIA